MDVLPMPVSMVMSTMISPVVAMLIALPTAALLGFFAQDSGLCLVRGVNDAKSGQLLMLSSILLSGAILWLFVPLAAQLHAQIPFARYPLDPAFLLGGLILGFGAAINGGCTVSTLSRLSRGEIRMLVTIIGWPVGWLLLMTIAPSANRIALPAPGSTAPTLTAVAALAMSAWVLRGHASRRRQWLGVIAFGALAGMLFIVEPAWSPSDYLHDVTRGIVARMPGHPPPALLRTLLILSVIVGMTISAWQRGSFVARGLTLSSASIHLIAGIAMGAGAALAMGGNDKQLLTGLPVLSPAAIGTVIAMISGILLAGPLARVCSIKE